ncbi:response regulator [Jiella mangrovi]|uniref:Response regulator n=1 Tax=Jiella mangrovi TaxID=2821407 RepID=A0ABS4BM79_9HYPH|nr:response regulator [Jiella mangrovi]MBP0617785.1 response regulator [Jiella mangrovi]
MTDISLSGVRVLVAEDEALVAMDLADMIEAEAGAVIGPFATVHEAKEAACASSIDVALLDVRLKDGEVYPAADALRELGVPLVFHSGHVDRPYLEERYPGCQCCSKPSTSHALIRAMNAVTRP